MEYDHSPLPIPPITGVEHRNIIHGLKDAKAQMGAARQRRNALLDAMEHVSKETLPYIRQDMEKARADVYFWMGRVEQWSKMLRSHPMM